MDIKDYLITKIRRVLGIVDTLDAIDRVLHTQKRECLQEI